MSEKFQGQWEITDMEQWNVEPGWCIKFSDKHHGSLSFICVEADIDYRVDDKNPNRADFSFSGSDGRHNTCGRGWVKIKSETMKGYLCFHHGDESIFTAQRMES